MDTTPDWPWKPGVGDPALDARLLEALAMLWLKLQLSGLSLPYFEAHAGVKNRMACRPRGSPSRDWQAV